VAGSATDNSQAGRFLTFFRRTSMKKTVIFVVLFILSVKFAVAQQTNIIPIPQPPVNYDVKPPLPYHTWTDGYRESWTTTQTHDIRPLHAWETGAGHTQQPTVTVYPNSQTQQGCYTPQQQVPTYYYPQQQQSQSYSQWIWYPQYNMYYNSCTGQWHNPYPQRRSGCFGFSW
jgi:hypothetical protein